MTGLFSFGIKQNFYKWVHGNITSLQSIYDHISKTETEVKCEIWPGTIVGCHSFSEKCLWPPTPPHPPQNKKQITPPPPAASLSVTEFRELMVLLAFFIKKLETRSWRYSRSTLRQGDSEIFAWEMTDELTECVCLQTFIVLHLITISDRIMHDHHVMQWLCLPCFHHSGTRTSATDDSFSPIYSSMEEIIKQITDCVVFLVFYHVECVARLNTWIIETRCQSMIELWSKSTQQTPMLDFEGYCWDTLSQALHYSAL